MKDTKSIVFSLRNYLGQRDRGVVLLLIVAAGLVYLPFLGNPFIFDDENFTTASFIEHYGQHWFGYELRWLPNASLVWTYNHFDAVLTHAYRLTSLILHSAVAITLYYFLKELIWNAVPGSEDNKRVAQGALFAALIFTIHPVMVYAAGYVIQRSILMATLFVLLMQWSYMRGIVSGQKRWLLLAVVAYFLAGFSKEHSVLAPVLLLAETFLLRASLHASRKALWFTWIGFCLIGLQIILLAKGVIGTLYEGDAASIFKQQELVASGQKLYVLSVITQAGLFFKYLLLWLVPNPAWMSIDMREHFISSYADWQSWLGVTGFVAYGVAGFWMLTRKGFWGLAGLAIISPWIMFIPELASVRVQEIFVLYRSYLWLPGLMILIPLIFIKLSDKKNSLVMIFVIMSLIFVPLSWNRLWVFSNNYLLWNDAAKLLKNENETLAVRIYYNRAVAEAGIGMWPEAKNDYERTIAGWDKENAVLRHDLGVTYLNLGRYADAMTQFDKAITLEPKYPKAYFDRGFTLKRMGQDEKASQQMSISCGQGYQLACAILKLAPARK